MDRQGSGRMETEVATHGQWPVVRLMNSPQGGHRVLGTLVPASLWFFIRWGSIAVLGCL